MKAKLIFLLVIAIGSLEIEAQVPEFDLSKYARPTLSRQSLDLFFNLSGSHSYQVPFPDSLTVKNRNLEGVADVVYTSFKNNPKLQQNTSIRLSFNPALTKRTITNISERINNQIEGELYIRSSQLRYNQKQQFIGVDLRLLYQPGFSYAYSQISEPDKQIESESRSRSQFIDLDLPLIVGTGRIEFVQDARQGLFILRELEKRGHLARGVTEEEIREFADRIAELRNRRYFDFRLQKIWELEQIHAFLKEKGITDSESISYFSIIQDIWNFGNQNLRLTGNRFSIGIDPNFLARLNRHSRFSQYAIPVVDTTSSIERLQRTSFEPALYVSFLHSKPISESWQQSFNANVEIGLQRSSDKFSRIEDEEETYSVSIIWNKMPSLQASAAYSLAFYPNTRTQFQTEIYSYFSQTQRYLGLNLSTPNDYTFGNLRIGTSAYYYISPQTRLRFRYDVGFTSFAEQSLIGESTEIWDEFQSNFRFFQSASISLNFAWF